MSSESELAFERAEKLYNDGKRDQARDEYHKLALLEIEQDDAEGIRVKEQSIYRLSDILSGGRKANELINLLVEIRPFFGVLPKAKTAKIVRKLFDNIFNAGASLEAQEKISTDMVEWARAEKRTFLRHRLQLRQAQVYYQQRDTIKALGVINALLKEVRRLDDRALLVDIHLVEARVYYHIRNIGKARASLVAARTNANAIYCPPLAQAEIDSMSGVLHADEGDNKTAFSYLYEAFEGFHSLGDHAREARQVLIYMLLAKISTDMPDELNAVMTAKNVLEYKGRDIDAMHAVAAAYKNKDTHMFNKVREDYDDVFKGDLVAEKHLREMYDMLVEKHMLRVIRPYNRVQISYIADSMKLSPEFTEARLSQMILDKKLSGIVDQQHQCLVLFEEEDPTAKSTPSIYEDSLKTLESFDRVVTAMFDKMAGKFDHLIEKAAEEKKKKEEEKKEKQKKKDAEEKQNKKEKEEKKEKDKK